MYDYAKVVSKIAESNDGFIFGDGVYRFKTANGCRAASIAIMERFPEVRTYAAGDLLVVITPYDRLIEPTSNKARTSPAHC